jgi:hypothetical protein
MSPTSGPGLSGTLQSAVTTINRGVAGVNRDAAVVAANSAADGASDTLGALVDSRQQLLYTQAGARLMDTADEMLGTLLNIRA